MAGRTLVSRDEQSRTTEQPSDRMERKRDVLVRSQLKGELMTVSKLPASDTLEVSNGSVRACRKFINCAHLRIFM